MTVFLKSRERLCCALILIEIDILHVMYMRACLCACLCRRQVGEKYCSYGCWGEGIVRNFGKVVYTLLYLKYITNKNLLYSTGNSAQCYVAAWRGGELGENGLCTRMAQSLPCSPETITTLLANRLHSSTK